jgi:hypothetical protein
LVDRVLLKMVSYFPGSRSMEEVMGEFLWFISVTEKSYNENLA